MRLNHEALKAIRLAGGDSQETLARRAGLSELSLSRLERGITKARISTIRKLADALSVPVGAITFRDDDKAAS